MSADLIKNSGGKPGNLWFRNACRGSQVAQSGAPMAQSGTFWARIGSPWYTEMSPKTAFMLIKIRFFKKISFFIRNLP
jgi:hypothetical protein